MEQCVAQLSSLLNKGVSTIVPTTLLQCDPFALLVAYIFYHAGAISLEAFDQLTGTLLIALSLQVLSKCPPSINLPETSYPSLGPSHAGVDAMVTLLARDRTLSGEERQCIQLKQFAFLRKVYLLRNTLFDTFFSELPDGSAGVPFMELCNVLLCNDQALSSEVVEKQIKAWTFPANGSVRPNESFAPFHFIPLPYEYRFTYDKKYTSSQCPGCQTKSREPALCLLCGELLARCENTSCRMRSVGECSRVRIIHHFNLTLLRHNELTRLMIACG